MKKLSKRLLAVALAGVMATTMAVSASASTIITISGQTLRDLDEGETNTIAAAFRTNGEVDNSLKRTAQNFSIGSLNNSNLWRYYGYYYGK